MSVLGIIPARYASTRFPGKPLADINGKPMIQLVYESASRSKALDYLIVATDDQRIAEVVQTFGGQVVLTSADHKTGTDRCFEASEKMEASFDIIINIQGDEPFVDPSHIDLVAGCFNHAETQIGTLVKRITSMKELLDPNKPKVLVASDSRAIYFSRAALPYQRDAHKETWLTNHVYYKHIGIYGYRNSVLKAITKLSQSALEKAESLEQLRWLENGYDIRTAITETEAFSVDTPADLQDLLGMKKG